MLSGTEAGHRAEVVRLGFEVRVELKDDAGAEFTAQLTRGDVDALTLHEGTSSSRGSSCAARSRSRRPDEPLEHRHDLDEAPVAVAR